jgi:ABC-type nitrate/sulfonate/bicarbonate transport system substrate-binding protein
VLFTYADQQRAAQNNQTALATTGINNPAVAADQGITDLHYISGQQFGGQNLVLRKGVTADTWKALEGKTIGVVPGTYARVLFLVAAQEGGADLDKIKVVNVSVGATALAALRKGDVDGFVLFAPMTDQVVVEGIGYYPPKLDIGACSLGSANGGILANTTFLSDKALALNFMKAYVDSIHEMQNEAAFVKIATQLAGIKPDVAQAVAASILTAIYHMLKDGTMYKDLGDAVPLTSKKPPDQTPSRPWLRRGDQADRPLKRGVCSTARASE